jgi:hypothetical protein
MCGQDEVIEMNKDEAIMADCSTGCAASVRRRRGSANVLASRIH